MWYILEGQYGTDIDDLRATHRPAHLKRLEALMAEGRLLVAGPVPNIDAEDPGPAGFSGNLMVAEFTDMDAAQAWLELDPYRTGGVYTGVRVRPFLKVLP